MPFLYLTKEQYELSVNLGNFRNHPDFLEIHNILDNSEKLTTIFFECLQKGYLQNINIIGNKPSIRFIFNMEFSHKIKEIMLKP
jgi:hypothetical protein